MGGANTDAVTPYHARVARHARYKAHSARCGRTQVAQQVLRTQNVDYIEVFPIDRKPTPLPDSGAPPLPGRAPRPDQLKYSARKGSGPPHPPFPLCMLQWRVHHSRQHAADSRCMHALLPRPAGEYPGWQEEWASGAHLDVQLTRCNPPSCHSQNSLAPDSYSHLHGARLKYPSFTRDVKLANVPRACVPSRVYLPGPT